MSFTYGFYNSVDHDRVYDAVQMASIFDGIINDGVYETIGDAMMVKAVSGNNITVGTGRAWFNHTWSLNDSLMPLTLLNPGVISNRYDAIVLEVNSSSRVNEIKILYGEEAQSPSKPSLVKSDTINQYPLAYIYRSAGSQGITQSNIENTVGTSECPFAIGVLKTLTIDDLVAQWTSEWNDYLDDRSADMQEWMAENQLEFETWFNNLQYVLDDDVAANLAQQISDLNDKLNALLNGEQLLYTIDDSNGEPIQDYAGNNIQGGVSYSAN